MYDNTMWGFCQDSARRFLAQRLILFQDGVQPQLPGTGQQVAVAAQKGLPLVDALFDEEEALLVDEAASGWASFHAARMSLKFTS